MRLSVVLPAYNEAGTIEELVSLVRAVPVDKEAMQYPDVRVILQERNMMKGNSVRRGIAAALGDTIIIQDADLEYDPQDYRLLLAAMAQEDVFAVIGSRLAGVRERGEKLPASPFNLGRQAVNWFFRLVFGSPLTDVASCYKLAPRSVYQSLVLRSESCDLDFEIAAKFVKGARRAGKRVVEVPIHYYPRTAGQGKKLRYKDGLSALRAIARYRFRD